MSQQPSPVASMNLSLMATRTTGSPPVQGCLFLLGTPLPPFAHIVQCAWLPVARHTQIHKPVCSVTHTSEGNTWFPMRKQQGDHYRIRGTTRLSSHHLHHVFRPNCSTISSFSAATPRWHPLSSAFVHTALLVHPNTHTAVSHTLCTLQHSQHTSLQDVVGGLPSQCCPV